MEEEHGGVRAGLQGEITQLTQALSQTRDRVKSLEAELGRTQGLLREQEERGTRLDRDVADRDQRITTLKSELAQLERDHTNVQDQLLRAHQKIKADETTVLKAKRAMAIALTLLDGEAVQAAEKS